jgi:hypothetical protein
VFKDTALGGFWYCVLGYSSAVSLDTTHGFIPASAVSWVIIQGGVHGYSPGWYLGIKAWVVSRDKALGALQ